MNYRRTIVQKVTDDGEVITENEKVVSFYNPFKEGRGYNFKYKSCNIKSYLDIPLPRDKDGKDIFADAEIGKLYRLSREIYSDTNLLAYRSENLIKPYTKSNLQDMINLHRSKFNPFWNKVIKNRVIKAISLNGNDYYCFNPLYFNSTTYLPIYLYIEFQDDLINYLPKWVIEKYLNMDKAIPEKFKAN